MKKQPAITLLERPTSFTFSQPIMGNTWEALVHDHFKALSVPAGEILSLVKPALSLVADRLSDVRSREGYPWDREPLPEWVREIIQRTAEESYVLDPDCQSRLFKFFRKRERSWHVAEDLLQAVNLKAVDKIRSGVGPTHSLPAWLFRIAKNTLINHIRHEKLQPSTDTDRQAAEEQAGASARGRGEDEADHAATWEYRDSWQAHRVPGPGDEAWYHDILDLLHKRGGSNVAKAIELAYSGHTQDEIGKILGYSDRNIRRYRLVAQKVFKSLR